MHDNVIQMCDEDYNPVRLIVQVFDGTGSPYESTVYLEIERESGFFDIIFNDPGEIDGLIEVLQRAKGALAELVQ